MRRAIFAVRERSTTRNVISAIAMTGHRFLAVFHGGTGAIISI
jgi:hypothetical protein